MHIKERYKENPLSKSNYSNLISYSRSAFSYKEHTKSVVI